MSGLWIAAFAALTLLVAVLAVVQVGLLRRVTAVIERAETAVRDSGGVASDGLQPGARIQPFPLTSREGRLVRSDDFPGESIWLLLSAGCGPCQMLAHDLRRHTADDAGLGMALRVVLGGEADASQLDLPSWVQVLLDGDQAAARIFRSSSTPHAFASADGVVKAQSVTNQVADLRRLAASARGEQDLGLIPVGPPPDLDLLHDHHHHDHHDLGSANGHALPASSAGTDAT